MRSFMIDECWITEYFSCYIVNLVKQVSSTSPDLDYFLWGNSGDSYFSKIRSYFMCAWNSWHIWKWSPIPPSTLSSMHYYSWAQLWINIVNLHLSITVLIKTLSLLSSITSPICTSLLTLQMRETLLQS